MSVKILPTLVLPCGHTVYGTSIGNSHYSFASVVCKQCETKSAQVAAIRQRLGDIAAGACGFGYGRYDVNTKAAIAWAIMEVFRLKVPVEYTKCDTLDSLAVWLWERGVRA